MLIPWEAGKHKKWPWPCEMAHLLGALCLKGAPGIYIYVFLCIYLCIYICIYMYIYTYVYTFEKYVFIFVSINLGPQKWMLNIFVDPI